MISWQFIVSELCADFSEALCPSNTHTENSRKGLSKVTLVAMKNPFLK
jgi:hypothetical protein